MAHPQDNRPLSFRMLVGLNVAILVLSVVVGACFFRGALGFADGVNMFSPYPKISVRIAATPYEYVSDWYNHMNGRVSQAIMDCGLFVYAKAFARTPEAFPWWLMRSLSLFCAMAAPFNFLVPAIGRGNCGLGAILGLYLTILVSWMLSYNVVTYSLWFDVLLTDRFLPIYVISLMCIILHRGWFEQTLFGEALHGALYLFFAVEQFLVTMPILFLAFACSHTHGRLFFSVRDGPWDACGLSEIAHRHRDRWNHNGDFAHSFCRQSLDDSLGNNWGVHRPDLQRGEASATICCRREDG